MSDFPRMQYRTGTMMEWQGHSLDYQIVHDADEEAAGFKDGWRVDPEPLDHDGDGAKGGAKPKRAAK